MIMKKFLIFCILVLLSLLCVCSCAPDEVTFVCDGNDNTTQCEGPCGTDMFEGPHGLCTKECSFNEDCPHYEEYGEYCLGGLCGFMCFDESDCGFTEYSCIEELAVCGVEL